jgi:small subunit ribosomal protein S16
MIRIRLSRKGLKGQPVYRIVVTDQRSKRDGGYLEIIGHYNPRTRPQTNTVDEARALYWLSVGAQPSESAAKILKRTGTMDRLARMRKGEAIEALVAEAIANAPEAPSSRTTYPAPEAGKGRKALAAAAKAAAAAESDAK